MEDPSLFVRILMKIDPLILYTIFWAFKIVLLLVDQILDLLLGVTLTKGTKEEREAARNDYEKSAQLAKVIGRCSPCVANKTSPRHFMVKHEKYIHPKFVLENDHVTLFMLSRTHAYFCATDPNVSVYLSPSIPFTFIFQFLLCQQLVIMPMASFNRLADEITEEKKTNLIFIANTARCGSVLLSQVLAKVPDTKVITEPVALHDLHNSFNNGDLTKEELRRHLRSAVKVLAKAANCKRLVLKHNCLTTPLFPMLKEEFPGSKFLFCTRMPQPSLFSFLRVIYTLPWSFINLKLGYRAWYECMPYPYEDEKLQKRRIYWVKSALQRLRCSHLSNLSLCYAANVTCYMQHKPLYDSYILYEHLVADNKKVIADLFQKIDFPLDSMEEALTAMNQHSQNHIFGKTKSGDKFNSKEITLIEDAFSAVGIPFKASSSLEEVESILRK